MIYRGNFSKHPVAPETGSLAYTRTRLAQSSDLELKPTQATLLVCLSLGCPMRPTSSWVKERSSQYLIYLVIISNCQPHNKFLHIEKNKKKIKISKQNIDIYIVLLHRGHLSIGLTGTSQLSDSRVACSSVGRASDL